MLVGTGIEDFFNSGFAFGFFGKTFHNDLSGLTHVHGSTGHGLVRCVFCSRFVRFFLAVNHFCSFLDSSSGEIVPGSARGQVGSQRTGTYSGECTNPSMYIPLCLVPLMTPRFLGAQVLRSRPDDVPRRPFGVRVAQRRKPGPGLDVPPGKQHTLLQPAAPLRLLEITLASDPPLRGVVRWASADRLRRDRLQNGHPNDHGSPVVIDSYSWVYTWSAPSGGQQ